MNEPVDLDLLPRLRLSPLMLASVPFLLAIVILTASAGATAAGTASEAQITGFGLVLLAVVTWLLSRWRPALGATFAFVVLGGSAYAASYWHQMPALLSLSLIPVGLTGLVFGLPAAAAFAVIDTVLLGVAGELLFAGDHWATILTSVAVVWSGLALLAITMQPTKRTTQWVSDFYQEALHLRTEAFSRRQALEQTLVDLGNANRQLTMTSRRMAELRILADEAQKTKTMFLAKVSHEFRTPLDMIIGLADLMVTSPQLYATEYPPEMERDLEVMLPEQPPPQQHSGRCSGSHAC